MPATSKWGILAKSTTIGLPEISCPSATLKFDGDDLKALELKISVSLTIFRLLLGISIPTKDFPSITSTTLTLLTDNDLAISWAMLVILLAFVPGAGWISNLVTTGPGKTDSTVASIPNSSSFVSKRDAISFNSFSERELPSSSALSSNSVLGIIAFSFLSWVSCARSSFGTSLNWTSSFIGKSGCFEVELTSSITFSLIWGSDEILDLIESFTFFSLALDLALLNFSLDWE